MTPNPARRALDLIGSIVILQRGIQNDIKKGVFRDYTRLDEYFRHATDKEIYHSGMMGQFPSFIIRAFEVVEVSRAGKRYEQTQSILARMVASLTLEQQSAQRGTQQGRFSKNKNKSGGNELPSGGDSE